MAPHVLMGKEHHWRDKQVIDVEWTEAIAHYYPFLYRSRKDLNEAIKRRQKIAFSADFSSLGITANLTQLGITVDSMNRILKKVEAGDWDEVDKTRFVKASSIAKELKTKIAEELVIFLLETE